MYKVNYYTLGKCGDGTVGNILQFKNVYYTENEIKDIPRELQRVVDIIYNNKYVTVIENIEKIKGHGNR